MSIVDYKLLKNTAEISVDDSVPDNAIEQNMLQRDIFNRITTRDISSFTRQLAALLKAGLPLVPALRALVEQLRDTSQSKTKHKNSASERLAVIIKQVADDVSAGSSMSAAIKKHPNVFSSIYVNMVAAGQVGGNLEEILQQLAMMLEKRVRLAGKVKAAIAYPAMMTVVATAVVVFLLAFVVPGITQIFVEMNRDLPLPTRFLIGISSFLKSYLLVILIIAGAGIFGLITAYKDKQCRLIIDRYKLKLPFFAKLTTKLETARMTRTLGTLTKSGVPIIEALNITKTVIQNKYMADSLNSVADSVAKGGNLAEAVKRTHLFPPVVYHVIATSLASGEIETGLLDLADMYDEEVEITARALTSLLEPAILLIMGLVVGFIVLAILLPIFEINQVF